MLWKFVQQKKAGRVICLSTHYMDEAEALGDTVAILAHGALWASAVDGRRESSSGWMHLTSCWVVLGLR